MKKYIFMILFVFVIVLIYRGIEASIERSRTEVMTIDAYQEQNGVPVVTAKAAMKDLSLTKSYTGSIRGYEQADAAAKIMEKIEKFNVTLGQKVREGQLLLTLDKQNPTAQYRQAKDALDNANNDLDRNKELLEVGAISQQVFEKVELAAKIAQANFDAVVSMLEVKSPISGTVTDIFYEKGETVSPGMPIMRIATLGRVVIEIQVGETEIPLLEKGQKALVSAKSFPDQVFDGSVYTIALSTDPQKRNFNIEILIPNSEMKLKPGMFSVVELIIDRVQEVIAVPADAVLKNGDTSYIYVVQSNMTVKQVMVDPGVNDGEWIEVPAGISEGDVVVIEGHNRLKDGVKVITESETN
ncbi:MAG: efflux RND transporter periplasmic adaptor subunit [bacterium]|nr:efflux RND transporter periplasmic adaptor subunit [bacterium]